MNLFQTKQILNPITDNPLKLETPLGYVESGIKINGFLISSLSSFKCTESNSFLNYNRNQNYEVGCLRTKFTPTLPPDMKVDECFAFIWRIKALDPLDINLNCLLNTSLMGSPETGEYLIAQNFEDHSINLLIGTEDEEKIQIRAKNNDWIPSHFQSTIKANNICYLDQGIELQFPLTQGEKIQLHFIVAWSSKNNVLSTWYAVEQSAREILNQVGFN